MVFKLNGKRDPKSLPYKALLESTIAVEENNTDALSTEWNRDFSGYKSRIMTIEYMFLFGASEVSAPKRKFEILWIEFSFKGELKVKSQLFFCGRLFQKYPHLLIIKKPGYVFILPERR